MVVVNCAWKQEEIIEIVEKIEFENKKIFKYLKKDGIRIFFECSIDDIEKACSIASKAIFKSEYGKALFYNVVDSNTYKWTN
jgi:hypothetical protein